VATQQLKKFDDAFSHFERIPIRDGQTDRQTNGQTYCASTVPAMHSIVW